MDFSQLIADLPVVVRHINEQKGKGVFATRKITEGEVIIKEDPIVACQYSYNKVPLHFLLYCSSLLFSSTLFVLSLSRSRSLCSSSLFLLRCTSLLVLTA